MLSQKDIVIIKNSSHWASRSLSTFKTLYTKNGKLFRDLIKKGYALEDALELCLDNFTVLQDKTTNDYAALTEFANIKNIADSVRFSITNFLYPGLFPKKPTQNNNKPTPPAASSTQEAPPTVVVMNNNDNVENIITTNTNLSDDNKKALNYAKQVKNNFASLPLPVTTKIYNLSHTVITLADEIIKNPSGENVMDNFEILVMSYEKLLNLILKGSHLTDDHGDGEFKVENFEIKTAAYNRIISPIKEQIHNIKQYIPYLDESSDIFSIRRNTILSTKEILNQAKITTKAFKDALLERSDDPIAQFKLVVNAYNQFAISYNNKIKSFSSLYDALKLKSKNDKMLKSRKELKDKQKGQPYSLSDFTEYSWSDLPSFSSSRFKKIDLIEIDV